jgi:hypothetical protein
LIKKIIFELTQFKLVVIEAIAVNVQSQQAEDELSLAFFLVLTYFSLQGSLSFFLYIFSSIS